MYKLLAVTIFYLITFGDAGKISLRDEATSNDEHVEAFREDEEKFLLARTAHDERPEVDKIPWHVELRYSRSASPFCEGSIVGQEWVLTAARCVCKPLGTGRINKKFIITSGNEYHPDDRTVHHVADVICHPNYHFVEFVEDGKFIPLKNDIALIRIKEPFVFSVDQQAIKIAESSVSRVTDGTPAHISGWRKLDVDNTRMDLFYEGDDMTIVSHAVCNKKLKDMDNLPLLDSQLCLKFKDSTNFCAEYGGGPAVVEGTQVGISSWIIGGDNFGCSMDGLLVYTNVTPFHSWISNHIDPSSSNSKVESNHLSSNADEPNHSMKAPRLLIEN